MHRFTESQKDIEGLRLACGKYSIQKFSSLLRLDKSGFKISAIGWIGNRIVIDILSDDKGEGRDKITLYIARRIDTQPSLVKTRYLDIYYSSSENNERFASHILSIDTSGITFDDLIEIVRQDPELGNPASALPAFENPERPENHLDSWGGKDLYANFFAEGEFARGQLDSVNIYENCVFIQHSDIECVSLKPNVDLRLIRFLVKYPWLSRNSEKYRNIRRDELPDVNKFFSTDLREKDIILGHNKVKEVIDYVFSQVRGKSIFLSNTCTPVVTGEDVESIVRQAEKKRKNLLYLTVTPQSMEVVLKSLFNIKHGKGRRSEGKSINLLGYEKDTYLEGLISFLAKIGISVNCAAIPDVSLKTLRKYFRGGADIIKPNSLWAHLYSQLNSASSHRYTAIDAPYGFEGTVRWIKEVANFVNLKIDDNEIYKRINPEILNLYEILKKKMKDTGIIFIIRKNEEAYLTDSARCWGVPLLNFFKEMGSRIEIFIKAADREEAQSGSSKILQLLEKYHNYEIRFFDSYETMMRLMRGSGCQIVFSNHSNDYRISSAGKNIVSLTDFEIGFDGTLYSMKRISEIASNRFFSKYFHYLRRDYAGRYEEK
ncbi:MAG: nitrogenase component 1 [Deltaproteobacteria bacterium]|nr:nitrogenase component 1 [Deltaproteobacteria bacterium]